MNKITLVSISILWLVAGCASTTPNYDAKFGDSVRSALAKQTINPDAGKNPDPATGIDGKASRETLLRYQGTFREPPPVVNVINIGGVGSTGN